MMSTLIKSCFAVLISILFPSAYSQEKACAMVLLHGKWGDTGDISHFGRRIEHACAYKAIEMPWSQRRGYDKPYLEAIEEIATEVQRFRSLGYKKVVIAGHSFGANAGLAYMATKGDADAIIALAPGHSPEVMFKRGMNTAVIQEAKQLVEAKKGKERIRFNDLNQSKILSLTLPSEIFLSYFNPEGIGSMTVTAKAFKKSVPVLLVIGTRDPWINFAKDHIFDNFPQHPLSKFVVVEAGHDTTEAASVPHALDWLKTLGL